jgi:hypothetical protein
MVFNQSQRVLRCRVVIGGFEAAAFQKVPVKPNGVRAVFWHGVLDAITSTNDAGPQETD